MKTVKLFYFNREPNFGDVLNEVLFERLFNLKVLPASVRDAQVVAIGSLLDAFLMRKAIRFKNLRNVFRSSSKPLVVFGTGFKREPKTYPLCNWFMQRFSRRLKVLAVRGEHTRRRVEEGCGASLGEAVTGDAGLLASYLLESKIKKEYSMGIIPHFIDLDNAVFSEIQRRTKHSIIINVRNHPLETIKQIAQCEVVVSSGLHALIAADSLNVPSQWIKVSNKISGGDYKFHDYYTNYNVGRVQCVQVTMDSLSQVNPDAVRHNCKISHESVREIQDRLYKKSTSLQEIV